jgi:hypothetical protein
MKKKKGPSLPKLFTAFKRISPVWVKKMVVTSAHKFFS